MEHVCHVRVGGNVPVADILIERVSVFEHPDHIGDGGRVPVADVLIERRGAVEHGVHAGDVADVPPAYVFVEGGLVLECFCHIGDGGDVPGAYVPVGRNGGRLVVEPQVHGGGEIAIGEDGSRRRRRHPAFLVEEVDGADVGKAALGGVLGADGEDVA